ncbi:MAG TPA: DUF4241 domain-containing protein [Kofleriaceae bacterium]|jgi:hypothetical protein|nr:DUF4241 domain-containing protein [Kofleriaceae bacterium]
MALDLHSAFGATSLVDNGKTIAVDKVLAGELVIPSGTIAAFDPLSAVIDTPFSREVPPGLYRVELLRTADHRIALARLMIIWIGVPVRWELATRPGEEARALRPGQIYGYRVDGGLGCFVDGRGIDAIREQTVVDMIAAKSQTTDAIVCWPGKVDANVIAFSAGYGDGVYASWWGFDALGRVVELVTDFGIGDFPRPALVDDPAYRRQWARAKFVELVAAVRSMAASGGDTGRMEAYVALSEIASLEDDAAEIVPDLIRELRSWKHDDVAADALLRLAKMLARHDCFQPEIAAWLATAPKDVATSFVFDHGIRRMQDELARVMAKIIPSISPMLLSETVDGLGSLEVGRDPFRPWLSSLAIRKDDVGDLARRVLASWS